MSALRSNQQVTVKIRPVGRQLDCLEQKIAKQVVLSMETIEPHFAWPLKVAALRLGVGETALKWYYLDSKKKYEKLWNDFCMNAAHAVNSGLEIGHIGRSVESSKFMLNILIDNTGHQYRL